MLPATCLLLLPNENALRASDHLLASPEADNSCEDTDVMGEVTADVR